MNILKTLKDNSFIVYASLAVFIITIINKLILFIYYSIPLDLITISLEDLYINGILIAVLIFLLFLVIVGSILALEMFVIHTLPEKFHRLAYEIVIVLYALYTFCIYSGLIEFILTGKIEKTKSTTIYITIVFVVSIAVGLLLKLFVSLASRKKTKKGNLSANKNVKYVFQEIIDSTGIRKVLYIVFAFLLLIGLTSSLQLSGLKNKEEYLIYNYKENNYALITVSKEVYIFKSYINEEIGKELLLINKSELVSLLSNK